MAKRETKTPIRQLPKDVQLEIQRSQAKVAQAKVDRLDAQREIEKHRAAIDKLREG